jgi:hypothetical protein
MEEDERKSYTCYECLKIISIPEDWVGNSYPLLETHYFTAHGFDMRSTNWKSKHPKDLSHKLLEIEMERWRREGTPGGAPTADAGWPPGALHSSQELHEGELETGEGFKEEEDD